ELDIQLYAYGLHFRSRFRSRSGSRSRFSLSYHRSGLAAAEIQTQTNAGLPFGVAVVQTMHHVHTGLDAEVLGQIVLHTNTGQSHGGTVTQAGEGLVQLLMPEATGNAGTDSTLAEMVNGFQTSHATVHAFASEVGFQALVSTQGGAQHGV